MAFETWLCFCMFLLSIIVGSRARDGADWTTDDFALFDLVEEVGSGVNFYDLLDLNQDCSLGDIKRAYRKLSLKLHPDRNDAPDASEKFRQLAAIYEVLKDEQQRQRYNDVLEFGLPDWRQPIFYYRKVRRMPWWESALLLFVIFTIGHYLMLWGAYWERKLNVMESVESRIRREERKRKKRQQQEVVDDLIEAAVNEQVPRPHWSSLLPFLLGRALTAAVVALPELAILLHQRYWPLGKSESEEEATEAEVVREPAVRFDPVVYETAGDIAPVSTVDKDLAAAEALKQRMAVENHRDAVNTAKEWSQEELALLLKLSTSKYPVGFPNRWERIAETLKRRVNDVTGMGAKLKQMDPKEYQRLVDMIPTEDNRHTWATNPEPSSSLTEWTQQQQKLFERALMQFGKSEDDRWDKISRCVPGKTKEQCIARYKELAEIIKQRKKKE